MAWVRSGGGIRVDGPDGAYDLPASKLQLLGFDLQGNLLLFRQPRLVRPHQPGELMPAAVGTLGDSLCSLVRRVEPQTGKKLR